MKKVLDVCCGSKGMWFDKNDNRCLYLDIRNESYINDGSDGSKKYNIHINPDFISNFTNIDYPDNSFWHIVFDPPHLKRNGFDGEITKRYGILKDDWREELRAGFNECFRLLKPNGTLVFKWSSVQFPIQEVLKLTDKKPLYGHKSGKKMNTHWVCFIKD
tara:strand:- start:57 stop:536 length:480 start_codon:yes stop_codon:yes gene_type:complete